MLGKYLHKQLISEVRKGGNMNIIDLRKNLRRSSVTRLIADRRKVSYPFGSPEWLEHIKNNHLDCPKFERRKFERRTNERRSPDRRQELPDEPVRSEKAYSRILLTPAERKLIEDLYFSDFE
ncbi:MAG: hypothetical protein ACXWTS_01225 [Methylococcaceae bacterium]